MLMDIRCLVVRLMIYKAWVYLLLLTCFLPAVYAEQETVTVAGANWPGFVNPDGSGTYLEPIKKAFANTAQLKWDISQFERARRLFLAGRADILVGVYRNTYPDKLYPSEPLDVENELLAYYLPERITLNTLADLDGKVIAWHRGYEFQQLLNQYASHLDYDDSKVGFTLLASGKIDVVLDYAHNVPAELQNQLSSVVVLPKETLWLVFQNTPKGQRLLQQFEAAKK